MSTTLQSDNKVRVVMLSNLKAMCEHVSVFCHRFEVSKVTKSRIHVDYSNPNEYGTEHPMTAVFPCYPNHWDKGENPYVVLEFIRVINDDRDGEGWQCFTELLDCPKLWRNPMTLEWVEEPK